MDALYHVGDVVKAGSGLYLCTKPPAKGSLSLDYWALLMSPGVRVASGPTSPGSGGALARLTGYTVDSLPVNAGAGDVAFVTDSLGRTLDGDVHGGGAARVVVWFDGTNWKQT
jgi:hypothetical protein